jgi:hypothetical protein
LRHGGALIGGLNLHIERYVMVNGVKGLNSYVFRSVNYAHTMPMKYHFSIHLLSPRAVITFGQQTTTD